MPGVYPTLPYTQLAVLTGGRTEDADSLHTHGPVGSLQVYQDGDLTFAVQTGVYLNGDTLVSYAGAAEQALTDDATNYIYLLADGTLTVNTTGFPVPSETPHIRLATILTADGTYDGRSVADGGDVTDYRGTSLFQVASNNAQAAVAPEAITAGPGSPRAIVLADHGRTFTNTGATAKAYASLPAGTAGQRHAFQITDADGLRITAASGVTIRMGPTVTKAAGYIESTDLGASVTLLCVAANNWQAVGGFTGAWTVETA